MFNVYKIKVRAKQNKSNRKNFLSLSPALLAAGIHSVQIVYIWLRNLFNGNFTQFSSLLCGDVCVYVCVCWIISALALSSFSNVIALCGLLEPGFAACAGLQHALYRFNKGSPLQGSTQTRRMFWKADCREWHSVKKCLMKDFVRKSVMGAIFIDQDVVWLNVGTNWCVIKMNISEEFKHSIPLTAFG